MTLPTTTSVNGCDDDSDMFGPPRSSPPIGYHHHRSRVPMISPKLRQREERKRILQLCAHKLERIKDSETNLRRSVCINNTYCRLTDELRREKQSRYLANLPKSETKPETARDNIFNPYNSCGIDNSNHQPLSKPPTNEIAPDNGHALGLGLGLGLGHTLISASPSDAAAAHGGGGVGGGDYNLEEGSASSSESPAPLPTPPLPPSRRRQLASGNIDNDLEILDLELSAINSPMPLIDPEITQGAEQLEKAISSRKRQRSEDESDRLVREALSQFYIPPQRLISAIEDCPLDIVNVGSISPKRPKLAAATGPNELDIDFDLNQNQKEFEVIMDALRLGSPTPPPPPNMGAGDSCGQAAMMGEAAGVFHNLVVTSLET